VLFRILSVSGSLRFGSSNGTLLAAAARLAPPGVVVESFDRLADIPAFSPDLEEDSAQLPPAVVHWRHAIGSASALLISSPEYAHGIPGALKNALDWLVGGDEIVGKAVGLLNASAVSAFAHPQLVEVLTVMNANIVPEASVLLDIPRRGMTVEQILDDPDLTEALRAAIESLRVVSDKLR